MNVFILLYGKTLKESMVDEKLDERGASELKKIYNQNLDNREEILKNTHFKVEDVIGNILKKKILFRQNS